jgi:hypothetical protein
MTAPTPVISIDDCGVALPAWALRLLVALVAGAVVAVLAADGVPVATLTVLALMGAATAVSPASAAPAALAVAAALATLLGAGGADGPLRPAVLALIPLVHLLHVTSALSAVVPHGARLHLPALRRTAQRFLAMQAGVFALAGVAWLLPHGTTPAHLEVVTVLGVAALAAIAIALLRRR